MDKSVEDSNKHSCTHDGTGWDKEIMDDSSTVCMKIAATLVFLDIIQKGMQGVLVTDCQN